MASSLRRANIGTILAAERIGGKKLSKYLKKFGIGQPTGLEFPGESNGSVPEHEDWSPTSFPTISFGQGLSVNSVQVASVYSTIANDGLRVEPSLVKTDHSRRWNIGAACGSADNASCISGYSNSDASDAGKRRGRGVEQRRRPKYLDTGSGAKPARRR